MGTLRDLNYTYRLKKVKITTLGEKTKGGDMEILYNHMPGVRELDKEKFTIKRNKRSS